MPVLPHVRWRKAAYAGIPPTKTCINCHSQIWTNAKMLKPVRESWATGASINWIRVHDLPDYVYFNHEIHVNKGIGCASCHGRVDEMPLMYQQNTLQMEWCLNCHRNPATNLRPTSEIYNMAWSGPSSQKPVWCAETPKQATDVSGRVATAQLVSCTTTKPPAGSEHSAGDVATGTAASTPSLKGLSTSQSGTDLQPHPQTGEGKSVSDVSPIGTPQMPVQLHRVPHTGSPGQISDREVPHPHVRTSFLAARCATDELCSETANRKQGT